MGITKTYALDLQDAADPPRQFQHWWHRRADVVNRRNSPCSCDMRQVMQEKGWANQVRLAYLTNHANCVQKTLTKSSITGERKVP
jgi:hypothetical protein